MIDTTNMTNSTISNLIIPPTPRNAISSIRIKVISAHNLVSHVSECVIVYGAYWATIVSLKPAKYIATDMQFASHNRAHTQFYAY